MNTHTSDFLETLLWVADSPDMDERPLEGASIHQFTDPFKDAVSGFIAGFLQYLEACDFDMDRLDHLERSLGGNVFFSLSGHGCGFFDETGRNAHPGNYPDGDPTLGDELQAHLETYAGGRHRFEELDYSLDLSDEGTIDLSILPEYLDASRARMFMAPWIEDVTPATTPEDAPRVFEATAKGFTQATDDTPANAVSAFYAANR